MAESPLLLSANLRLDGGPVRQWPAMLLTIGVFFALSLAAAVTSSVFLEGDACTHYLYSRFAFAEPHLLTNVWGRPFCTAIYAVPAAIGQRLGVRLSSALLAVAIGLICCRVAKNQGYRWPGLALMFLLGQPILFLHSFSELTELPFALLAALALWAYQARQWLAMALLVGLMPTARPEAFGFILAAGAGLVLHRRWWWIPMLFVPLAAWSFAGWWQFGRVGQWWQWLPQQWPYSTESVYDKGPLLLCKRQSDGTIALSFLLSLPAVVSPFVFPAVLLGAWLSLRFREVKRVLCDWTEAAHRHRVDVLIAAIPLAILASHSVLWWRGKMASNGELRYLVVAAPMWALLAARGWEWAFSRLNWRHALRWAGVAILLPIFANAAYKIIPLQTTHAWRRAEEAANWRQTSGYAANYPRMIATDRAVYYFLDISPTDWSKSAEWSLETVLNPPDGAMLIWDPIYGMFNSDASRKIGLPEIEQAGWVRVHTFPAIYRTTSGKGAIARMEQEFQKEEVGQWHVFLSPKDKAARTTPR